MSQRKKAYYIIGGSVAFLIGLLLLKLLITPKPLCDPSVKAKTVILIDHSEDVSTQTIDAIVERAWEQIEKFAQDGELVSIYDLTKASKQNLKPSFEACKPRSEGSQSIENVKRVKLEFENFKKKLRTELAVPIKGSDESPIAQAIIDLSLDTKHFKSTDVTKLIVFSDFMEHTSKFSLYKCTNPEQSIQQFRNSRTGALERPEFTNVEVQMHIVPRKEMTRGSLQCRALFWNWFFGDNKGSCKKESCLSPEHLPG